MSEQQRLWIRHPLAIFTNSSEDAGGGLVVEGNRIVELVPRGAQPSTPWESHFDASNHVLIPGLINTHHHFYQTLTRALPEALNKELFPWLQTLYPVLGRAAPGAAGSGHRAGPERAAALRVHHRG